MKRRFLPAVCPIIAALLGGGIDASHAVEPVTKAAAHAPIPADFPALSARPRYSWLTGNGSGMESRTTLLFDANYELLDQLRNYTADSVAATFGERLSKEQDVHMKLLLAGVAATHGHNAARKFIEGLAEDTDYDITMSRLSTLRYLVGEPAPQEWVFDAVHQALGDTRQVTGATRGGSIQAEVSWLADECELLTYALGRAKPPNPKSVPILVDMAKRTNGSRGPVSTLGMIGDPRGIPICLEFLAKHDAEFKQGTAGYAPQEELLWALGGLKAGAAVPTLLNYLFSEKVIAALGRIGDERAIEPLRGIVAAGGLVEHDPSPSQERFQARVFAARMALIKLEKDDPVPKWIVVLEDASLGWVQRREAAWELGWHPDARAIGPLLGRVKSDPNGAVVNQSIMILATYRYNAAVEGLIECFDADFRGKEDWKRAITPEDCLANIGRALKDLTGQDFGSNKAAWRKWWNESGKMVEGLK